MHKHGGQIGHLFKNQTSAGNPREGTQTHAWDILTGLQHHKHGWVSNIMESD